MRLGSCTACAALALVFVPASALAGDGCGSGFDVVTHIFETSDRDGSGTLSPEEFEQAGLARYGVSFGAYDTNGDGEASLDEYREIYDRYHLAEGEIES
jgi:Ca2+-binding EF-hand superfamily protein